MELMPILATLKRHKTAAGLIVLQVALTCTIVCNALFLISQRLERIQEPSGMADEELVTLRMSGVTASENPQAQTEVDLAALRRLPGVRGATLMNQVPYGPQFSVSGLRLSDDSKAQGTGVPEYRVGEGGLALLGLRLVEGRDFMPEEFRDGQAYDEQDGVNIPALIISRATASRLFPAGPAVGQKVWGVGSGPSTIVGVVDRMISPHPGGADENALAMILPLQQSFQRAQYVLRVDVSQRDAVLKAAGAALDRVGPDRILRDSRSWSEARARYYAQDRSMVGLLVGVCVALMVVTAFGIVGLASFWVQQRTRMIGTRRALGATRGQILRYFQTENFLLSTLGIVLGVLGAAGLSSLLVHQYELPGLPWHYLPFGALALWLLGQLAVLGPARRAAALPPVAALRS
ncbi:MAG TPA: FtsX-like permease family protein [Burkholderiaceae bacterium]|nr:FtsX-like permease family protein [Burkholderiaceae bacterium]